MNQVQSSIGGPDISSKPSFVPKRSSLIIKIVIGVVVILVVGIGVALAARVWDPLWNPFRSEPQEVLEKMYQNMKEAKSLHVELVLNIEENSSSEVTIIKLSNDSDKLDPNNTKSKGEIEVVSGDKFSFKLNYVIINKKLFFKIDNISPIMGMDLSFFQGKWIESGESFKQDNQESKTLGESIEEIKEILIFKQELKDEKIDNKRVYHYLLEINEEKLKELSQIATPVSGIVGGVGSIEKQVEDIKDFEINYFIGKRDELLYKISAYKEVEEESRKESLSFEMTFSDFNKELYIEAPQEAQSLEEVLEGLFGESIEGLMQSDPSTY